MKHTTIAVQNLYISLQLFWKLCFKSGKIFVCIKLNNKSLRTRVGLLLGFNPVYRQVKRQHFPVKCTHSYPISLYTYFILHTPVVGNPSPRYSLPFPPCPYPGGGSLPWGWQGAALLPQTTLKKVNNSIPVALCYLHPLPLPLNRYTQTFLQMTSAFKSFSFPKLLSPSPRCIVVFWCKKRFNFFRIVVRWFSARRSFGCFEGFLFK